MTRLGVQYERYWVWADPRCLPLGAKPADPKVAAEIRGIVKNARRPVAPERITNQEEYDKGQRWLTYLGPSVRRSVLVVIDAPKRKPTRYWHASLCSFTHVPRSRLR